MKIRTDTVTNGEAADARPESGKEMRELAEAISLYRSAMRHVAEKQPARPWAAERRAGRTIRMRLMLVPVLAGALVAAVMAPTLSHLHHGAATRQAVAHATQAAGANTQASLDDTALMNQIDSEISEEVPDALQPLAELSEQAATTKNSVTEKANGTQE